ncbi:hypothetical protein GQ457_12G017540 [Hibiscus cannabinus]
MLEALQRTGPDKDNKILEEDEDEDETLLIKTIFQCRFQRPKEEFQRISKRRRLSEESDVAGKFKSSVMIVKKPAKQSTALQSLSNYESDAD